MINDKNLVIKIEDKNFVELMIYILGKLNIKGRK